MYMLAVTGRRRPRREVPPDAIKLLDALDRLEVRLDLLVAFLAHFVDDEFVVQTDVRVHVASIDRREQQIAARPEIIPLARRQTLAVI